MRQKAALPRRRSQVVTVGFGGQPGAVAGRCVEYPPGKWRFGGPGQSTREIGRQCGWFAMRVDVPVGRSVLVHRKSYTTGLGGLVEHVDGIPHSHRGWLYALARHSERLLLEGARLSVG